MIIFDTDLLFVLFISMKKCKNKKKMRLNLLLLNNVISKKYCLVNKPKSCIYI